MIHKGVVIDLRLLAGTLGPLAEGSQWFLFGSAVHNDPNAADIDLMILCKDDDQADALRAAIDPDCLPLPLDLALLTFDEAAEVDAISVQQGRAIFPYLISL